MYKSGKGIIDIIYQYMNTSNISNVASMNISDITILAAVNLPPGLSWEPNQTDFNPQDETDGCVKLCGTPLQPGFYEIEVIAQATILLISQTSSFVVPIYIAPQSSDTDPIIASPIPRNGLPANSFSKSRLA